MQLVGRQKLAAFAKKHADVRPWVAAWVAEVEAARWTSPMDICDRYASASIINDQIVILNVKGNQYRLEIHVSYASQIVSVIRWGTHADYDSWTW